MENTLTNKNEIAGIPNLALRQFLIDCDGPFRTAYLAAELHLKDDQVISVLDALIAGGYVSINENGGLDKTSKAQLLIDQAGLPLITREASYNVVLNVLRSIDEVNTSAMTAHRVSGAKVLTEVLSDADDQVPFVEIEISIRPAADRADIQGGMEGLAAGHAYEHGESRQVGMNDQQRSINFIRRQLSGADPHALLHFIIE